MDMAIREVLIQRIQGVKNEKGVYVTTAFPKLIYCLDECNYKPGTEYWETTKLACACSVKRMVPDFISAKKMREYKIPEGSTVGDVYPCMGCRSFLTPHKDHKYYGRFNCGVVTINLPDIALSSKGDEEDFWRIFDERLDLCYKALLLRIDNLKGTPSDVAPILWQYGALARLKKGETIDELLKNNYSTVSLGYAGLYECVKYMTGHSHSNEGKEFGLKVMQHLNDATAKWKAESGYGFSLYGTPMETQTYRFAKCLQQRFGIIEGITDRNYITNSYHIPVFEQIDAFSKFSKEAEFQKLSPGGAISYVEIPDLKDNPEAIYSVIEYIYNTIQYAELNSKSDFCQVCSYEGEMEMKQDSKSKKLFWRCPNCGNDDFSKMNIARRTCGYIGTYGWNQGRMQEINERVLHL